MIKVERVSTEAKYYASYSAPFFNLGTEQSRHSVLSRIMNLFGIRLNNIKFGTDTASEKFISFNKLLGNTFFNVSLGIEDFSVIIDRPKDETQIYNIINNVVDCVKPIKGFDIGHQRIIIAEHFSTDENIDLYFNNLNPNTPEGFSDNLKNKGVSYRLFEEEFNCTTNIVVETSFLAKEGIYISVDLQFSPNNFSFNEMFKIAKGKYKEITSILNIEIDDRGNNVSA